MKELETRTTDENGLDVSEIALHWISIAHYSQMFARAIKIMDAQSELIPALALLDTLCQSGDWISKRLVQRLGKQGDIKPEKVLSSIKDANGREVEACGTIKLHWKWCPRGVRIFDTTFNVFSDSRQFDVIFGVEFIFAQNIMSVNEEAMMAPLTAHKKIKPSKSKAC